MTGLLVSVRSAAETRAAIAGGADWIDVKEPRHGALGAAEPAVWDEVAEALAGKLPLSAAVGELIDPGAASAPSSRLVQCQFAKAGLAGCGACDDWPDRWRRWAESLPQGVAPVAVVYADFTAAAAPPPEAVLEAAARFGAKAVLFDTFDKTRGDLFSHLSDADLARLIQRARGEGMLAVVGGSLQAETLPRALAAAPDVIAVRGAACRQGRDSEVDDAAVRHLKEVLNGLSGGFLKAAPCLSD